MSEITETLSTPPVLGYYDVNEDVTISIDISSQAVRAVLLQKVKPIVYTDRALLRHNRITHK